MAVNKTVDRAVTGDDVADGTPVRRIRMEEDLWERFEESCKHMDPDDTRSALIRRFVRWHVGDIDEVPRRPEPGTAKKLGSPRARAGLPLAGTQ